MKIFQIFFKQQLKSIGLKGVGWLLSEWLDPTMVIQISSLSNYIWNFFWFNILKTNSMVSLRWIWPRVGTCSLPFTCTNAKTSSSSSQFSWQPLFKGCCIHLRNRQISNFPLFLQIVGVTTRWWQYDCFLIYTKCEKIILCFKL